MAERAPGSVELKLLFGIEELLQSSSIRKHIEVFADEIRHELEQNTEKVLVWRSIPFSLYGERLPEEIKSSWVFGIQAKRETGAERHPRSHQRMMSYRGSGDLRVWDGNRWISRKLVSDTKETLGKRWISIAPNTWHQAVTGDTIWIVVSFHTVADGKLVEERPDPNDPIITHKRRYLG
jgi:hypothetical protein